MSFIPIGYVLGLIWGVRTWYRRREFENIMQAVKPDNKFLPVDERGAFFEASGVRIAKYILLGTVLIILFMWTVVLLVV